MRTRDFHYDLPPELIAQHPARRREESRLMVLHRAGGRVEHRRFPDLIEYLRPGDVLVLNDSRVIPARLRGRKPASGGEVEVLLVEESEANDWWVMLRPGKRVRAGTRIQFEPTLIAEPSTLNPQPSTSRNPQASTPETRPTGPSLAATVTAKNAEGLYRLQFEGPADVRDALDHYGETPLPPYIERSGPPSAEDRERYQTVFAAKPGSVAAPTAGLHFTASFLDQVKGAGVEAVFVTLHVGLGTFAPVKAERLEDHVMHEETFEVPEPTRRAVATAKAEGRRVVAVGTTAVRVLESVAAEGGFITGGPAPETRLVLRGRTRLFLRPPAAFRMVDALVTNFHLPESTLLMLACAFAAPASEAGRGMVLHAYAEAIRERYRFFSYGDAMLIV